jgi:hypothetical protein
MQEQHSLTRYFLIILDDRQVFAMGFWWWIFIVNIRNISAISMTTKLIGKKNLVIYIELTSDTTDIGLMSVNHNTLGG